MRFLGCPPLVSDITPLTEPLMRFENCTNVWMQKNQGLFLRVFPAVKWPNLQLDLWSYYYS